MSPIKKKVLNESKAMIYRAMSPSEKDAHDKRNREKKKIKYKQMDHIEKSVFSEKRAMIYKAMSPNEKDACRKRNRENMKRKYMEMDSTEKKAFSEKRAVVYEAMSPSEKDACRKRNRENKKTKYHERNSLQKPKKAHDLDYYISNFYNKIKEGPYYICSVCNCLLYKKSVKLLAKKSYSSVPKSVFTSITSFDNKEYICKTCHLKVVKGRIPCQAVYNDMSIDEIPPELALLEKLEQILIAQRIVFEKIVVMPKGQQKKVSGAICNVPVNCDQTCKVLPRPPERSGIILLTLKRKLEFRGHVYFQAVRPQLVKNALSWLMQNNPLYNNVTTDMNNISDNLKTLQNDASTNYNTSTEKVTPNDDENVEEIEDPSNTHRQATNETCLQSVLPDYPMTLQQSGSLGNEI